MPEVEHSLYVEKHNELGAMHVMILAKQKGVTQGSLLVGVS
jgi:hypothetical protein